MAIFNAPVVGLVTAPNPFSQAPAGSLARADNVRFVAPGVLGPRPGFDVIEDSDFEGSGARATQIGFYEGSILVSVGSNLETNISGTFAPYSGSYTPAGEASRVRLVGAGRDLFVNTENGVFMIGGEEQPVLAGNSPGLSMSITNYNTATWMPANSAVAYRYTICSLDPMDATRVIEGAPSGPVVLRNYISAAIGGLVRSSNVVTVTCEAPHGLLNGDVVALSPGEANFPAGNYTVTSTATATTFTYSETAANATSTVAQVFSKARNAAVNVWFKGAATTLNFIRLYRTNVTATASISPGDEMFLSYESPFLSSAEVSTGYIQIYDTTPESMLAVPLYTNENTGEGAAAANYQPPRCEDMVQWSNRLWFLNTENLQNLSLALLGVGSPNGIQANDTVEIAGTTYTAKASPSGYSEFQVVTSYGPDANVEMTARSLVDTINRNGQTDVWAYYVSSVTDWPGQMLIVRRAFLAAPYDESFNAYSSRATAWNPQLSANSSADYIIQSDNNKHPAGLYFSKLNQFEAVPPDNWQIIDSDADKGIRAFPQDYRLLVFKASGIYAVTGTDKPFTVTKISNARLVARDSVAALAGDVYALTDQGVLQIDSSGTTCISTAIDDLITPLYGAIQETVAEYAVGVGLEAQRQYLLWLPEEEDDETNGYALAWSTLSRGWTIYRHEARSAAVNPDGILVLGAGDANRLLIQNHSYTSDDFHDATIDVTVLSQSTSTVYLTDAEGIEEGDIIFDDDDAGWIITEADDVANTVTTFGVGNFVAGATTVHPAIRCDVEFNPITGGTPASFKTWQQASVLFRANELATATVSFETEVSQTETPVELDNTTWGSFEWGERPWGNPPPVIRRIEPLPLQDSQACQLSVSLQIAQADSKFEILGLVIGAKPDSDVNRG